MSASIPRPPLNPELAAAHQNVPLMDVGTPEKLHAYRQSLESIFTAEIVLKGKEDVISYEERDIPGPAGPMKATIFRPKHSTRTVENTPGFVHIHGGGLTTGNRFLGFTVLDWVETFGAICVTAEYRLAPEHPQPAALEDSYAALKWTSEHATELGFNPDKLVVTGGSAGGNLAAGVALLARDRSGPVLRGQVLVYPWVDDRMDSLSIQQYGDILPVTKENLVHAGDLAWGVNREHANMYTAPMRATDLSGLPPTWIDVGEADVVRDQDIAYAAALWRDGVSTELHVWPGCWHGFDLFVPEAPVSQQAKATRVEWLRKLLDSPEGN